eukprot:5159347-Pleurochrysis_carterae.AAC.1
MAMKSMQARGPHESVDSMRKRRSPTRFLLLLLFRAFRRRSRVRLNNNFTRTRQAPSHAQKHAGRFALIRMRVL